MQLQAAHEDTNIVKTGPTPLAAGIVAAAKWISTTSVLEVTVWLLVALWGLQLFTLWVKFLRWATLLEFPQ